MAVREPFKALVLAGSRPEIDSFAAGEGVAHKALIELEGKPLLARVVEALRRAGARDILVSCDESGPVAALARELKTCPIAQQRGPSGSVLAAFDQAGPPLLITTADHALLQPEWITRLMMQTPAEADLSLMMAEKQLIEQALPGSRRTYLRFADGAWSGCNLFYLQTEKSRKAMQVWSDIDADRKRPWRIAGRLGIKTLLAYALGRLTLAQGFDQLGQRFGLNLALVPADDGRAAIDADKPQDLADIKTLLDRDRALRRIDL
ncbi:MAG: nucleotidyltransferase family protein [Sphingomonadaceae bacterium]